ncbi:DUF4231 domain-containing protein [Pseudomaricurvus sp. HS19]|uniref:DUF4231 domain-containing protein n=1 Tax=Pseudomaricurvus sp. HS19 TaxID=2692626 RepID=UPI00136A5580|nr:DUF4231 domain-containing protein [Pseudomaricurvus sp. HS19]MYM62811.1 DUF4231 domain-containing protein [Pseudomaricurvus sp. HS19]
MSTRQRYCKRPGYTITAVQLQLDFDGFQYRKWGDAQTCRAGDWLVNNGGDVYTVAADYFADRYREISPGHFIKVGEVWAEEAEQAGSLPTLEGASDYGVGDYLVYDRQMGGAAYAVGRYRFLKMYEPMEPDEPQPDTRRAYLNGRLPDQISWYNRKAKLSRANFLVWQSLAIIFAALVPVLSGNDIGNGWAAQYLGDATTAVALLGGGSAVIVSLLGLFKCQENWVKYRATCEDLRSHLAQYLAKAGIYRGQGKRFELLVENCENIISAERGHWVLQNAKGAAGEQ